MAKSHSTCTCIKSSKEYCMLCVKDIARLYKCLHVMTIWEKLYFTILNYALDYTLHPKLSDCTIYTLNYYTLHPGVIFVVIFNKILLHVTSTYFLLRWKKVKHIDPKTHTHTLTSLTNFIFQKQVKTV